MDATHIPCRSVMRPDHHCPHPCAGRCAFRESRAGQLAALVRQMALAVLLSLAGAASACLPELGSSCLADSPTRLETPPALADDDLDDALRRTFALYLVGGRSDVQIHLSAAGPDPTARTRALGDGTHHCLISGLRPREPQPDRGECQYFCV